MDNIDKYKKLIITLVEKSKDINYIIALYSFATSYPDNSSKKNN